MFNRTLFSIIFVLIGLSAYAQQNDRPKKWNVGIIAGLQPQGMMFNTDKWEKTSGFITGVTF